MEGPRIDTRPRSWTLLSILLFVALVWCGPRLPGAQAAAPPPADQPPNGNDPSRPAPVATDADDQAARPSRLSRNIFAPPDRATARLLSRAGLLIERQRYAEAVRCLGAILESPQDYFFHPDRGDAGPRSLKAEAQRLLGQMSRQGSQLYELQYGTRARQLLDEAAAAGDAAGLAEVSRRFFHTRAGHEATLLLGLYQMDHGRPLAGALALERLQEASPDADQFEPALSVALAICWIRAGNAEKAARTLARLEQRHPQATMLVAGREVPLFGKEADLMD